MLSRFGLQGSIWLLLVSLLGCASNPDETATLAIDQGDRSVFFVDSMLAARFELVSETQHQVRNRTQASVVLKNRFNTPVELEYRFYWYDDQGLEVVEPSPWQTTLVLSEESITLSAIAPVVQASQFRVKIKDAQLNSAAIFQP
ncbi:YcfL family protein [Vibrio sp. SM6]|uniref:YcfL family protein n=1 Tax=Vibrio agarilyticus TaxID=2726741 RepID=A0A7X8TR33_9VIBR|nr:DUF1425 domain-containing protein [Vibrio agarilyticus]NLS13052.1 YcfL family protein [Vibrio agarilyticus]